MRRTVSLLAVLATISASSDAAAGSLYGTLYVAGHVGARVELTLICPGHPTVTIPTRDDGSFSVRVAFAGRCQMQVAQGPPFVVFIPSDALRYDLQVNSNFAKAQ